MLVSLTADQNHWAYQDQERQERYIISSQLTSSAACSKSSFLSAALKASSVLVLKSVPTAGQQWAGVGALLDTGETWLGRQRWDSSGRKKCSAGQRDNQTHISLGKHEHPCLRTKKL